jgi:hypothetical protein
MKVCLTFFCPPHLSFHVMRSRQSTAMEQKERERHLLEMVYQTDEFSRIIEGERPDFTLEHRANFAPFGAQVTEFYYTESDARLKNIPGYRNDLIENREYHHKDDKDVLEVGEIKVLRSDDKSIKLQTDVIIRDDLPSPSEYSQMIANRIEQKGNKYSDYRTDLEHINLIICDFEERLSSIDPTEFHKYFYTPGLKASLLETPFREVFLITRIDDGRRVYYPLKMLLLISELYIFGKSLDDFDNILDDLSMQRSLKLFTCFMRSRGAEAYFRSNQNEKVEVFLGDSSVMADQNGTRVHIHADRPLPESLSIPNIEMCKTVVSDDFQSYFREFEARNHFVSEIDFDVNKDITINY